MCARIDREERDWKSTIKMRSAMVVAEETKPTLPKGRVWDFRACSAYICATALLQIGSDWFSLVQDGSEWFSLVQLGSAWFRLVQNGSDWFRMVQIGSD